MAEIVFHTLKKLERDLQLAQVRYATERETSHVITQRVDAATKELNAIRETEIALKERMLTLEGEAAGLRAQLHEIQSRTRAGQQDIEILRKNCETEVSDLESVQGDMIRKMRSYFDKYRLAVGQWNQRSDVMELTKNIRTLCEEAGTVDATELDALKDQRVALMIRKEELDRLVVLAKGRLDSEKQFVAKQREYMEKSAREVETMQAWLKAWSEVAGSGLCPKCHVGDSATPHAGAGKVADEAAGEVPVETTAIASIGE